LILPLGILVHWVTLLAVPLASVAEQSGGNAIKQALQATFSNLPALIVNLICLIIVSVIVIFICIIPILIVSLVFSSSPTLMNIASIPFTALMTALIIALMSANMLEAYRDIFTDGEIARAKDSEFLM
jgi:membrane-anchored glycerophosphoryl diester phosphodiesterase (GDPDase)